MKNTSDELIKAVAIVGINGAPSDEEIGRIMRYIRIAIAESYQDLESVIVNTRDTIIRAGQTLEDMYNNKITPMIGTFDNSVRNFHKDLSTLNNQVQDIANASKSMATSSNAMAGSTTSLASNVHDQTAITRDIDNHLVALNQTEQNIAQEMRQVAGSMNGAASTVAGATNDMKIATTKVVDVGNQLIRIDATTINSVADQVRRVIYEAAGVATTLNQTNTNLQITIQELQKLVRGVKVKRKWFPWP